MTGERVKEEAMIGCDRCKHCDRLGCNQHEDVTGPYRATIPKERPMSNGEDRTTPRPGRDVPRGYRRRCREVPRHRAQAEWMVAEWSNPHSLTNLQLTQPLPDLGITHVPVRVWTGVEFVQ